MKLRSSVGIVSWCAVGALFTGGESRSDVISAAYANDQSFVYEIIHMPDLDQRRMSAPGVLGLPGDGNMYCAPTATMNLMAYVANHGYSSQAPGAAYWQSQSKYNDAGWAIFAMGTLMGTSATDGTGGGFDDGATAWVNPALFNVSSYHASGFYSPTIVNMTQSAMGGNIVAFAYGRYDYLGDIEPGAPHVGERTGGHVVTLSKAVRGGDDLIIAVRDP